MASNLKTVRGDLGVEFTLDHQGLRRSIALGSVFNSPYVVMNALATVVAAYGLLANSTAVVIGAMIVAMLLNPILGISMAIAESDHQLVKTSLIGLSGGFTGVVVV